MVDCKEYENKLWDLKPKDNELIEYVGFSCGDFKKFLNTLDQKNMTKEEQWITCLKGSNK